jgi:hypothetical protein
MSSVQTTGGSSLSANDGIAAGKDSAAKPGFWPRFKSTVIRIEKDFALLKLGLLSLLGTLIGVYFQSLSAYQDKVSAQAKDDMLAATDTFTETSNALSTAITLQSLLFYDFARAAKLNVSGDGGALTSKHAQDLYKPYDAAATALRENVNVIARKAEIYLDWASDINRDPATVTAFGVDPISTSFLGTVEFDCDQDMPKFDRKEHAITRTKNGKSLTVDWYSAKHHVFTIAYCFDVTHKTWMEIVRQWASQSSLPPDQIATFVANGTAGKLQSRLDAEVVRLNDFMSRAMNEIEGIRVKYRPTGFYCNLPGVSQLVGLFSRFGTACTPVRLRV